MRLKPFCLFSLPTPSSLVTSVSTTEEERGLLGGEVDGGHRHPVCVTVLAALSDGQAWNLLLSLQIKILRTCHRSAKARLRLYLVELPYPGYGLQHVSMMMIMIMMLETILTIAQNTCNQNDQGSFVVVVCLFVAILS